MLKELTLGDYLYLAMFGLIIGFVAYGTYKHNRADKNVKI